MNTSIHVELIREEAESTHLCLRIPASPQARVNGHCVSEGNRQRDWKSLRQNRHH